MANFGELVLVVGDFHIPDRVSCIPEKFQKMLVPNKMQHVLCTGNIGCKEQYDKIKELASNVHVVAGDMEFNAPCKQPIDSTVKVSGSTPTFPETRVISVGSFRIGLIHGHQIVPSGSHTALAMMRRKLDVDILISGNTHTNEVVEHDGGWHINPGSITGAFSTITPHVIPSFVLLAVQGPKVVCYVYKLIKGEVDVSKTEFVRKSTSTPLRSSKPASDSLFE